MGALMKLMDTIVFLLLLFLALAPPLLDAQLLFPPRLFPGFLIDCMNFIPRDFGHYLLIEKPNFYIGIAWIHLLFNWPLSVASLYAFAAGKSWFNTVCLIIGISFSTCLAAIYGELLGSGRASDKLVRFYYPFVGFSVLTIFRGLLPPHSCKTAAAIGKAPPGPGLNRKKRS